MQDVPTAIHGLPAAIVAAFIAATGSLIVAVINLLQTRATSRQQNELAKVLEGERARLLDANAETQAWRQYRYEALKRLYAEVNPLLFQMIRPLEQTSNHVLNMARAARKGWFDPQGENWLADGYYLHATMHRLMLPVAFQSLIESRLTLVDLSLEPKTAAVYALLTEYSSLWRHDFAIGEKLYPETGYRPALEPKKPEAVDGYDARQGILAGKREKMAEALIQKPDAHERHPRPMGFGAFDAAMATEQAFEPLKDILTSFQPKSRPVFWALVVTASGIAKMATQILRGPAKPDFKAAMAAADEPEFWQEVACAGSFDPLIKKEVRDVWEKNIAAAKRASELDLF